MTIEMIYILPMLLGRTFDARNDLVGRDIFPPAELTKAMEIQIPELKSVHKVAETAKDVRDVLEVSGDLALKVKAGKIDLKGAGSYLRNTMSSEKTVEVLTRMTFQTVVVSLPSTATPFKDWASQRREDLGTHFVRSVTYGGEIVASIRFRAYKDEDMEAIKAEVSGNLQGQLENLVAEGKLDTLEKSLKEKASLEISYFATVPLKGVPNTIDGLKNLVTEFKNHVQEVNSGKGVPIRVELVELSSLDKSFPEFVKDEALDAALEELEGQFDELREAKARLTDWVRTLPPTLTHKQEDEITAMMKRLTDALRPYYSVIGTLDVESGPEQLDPAFEAYNEEDDFGLPGKFRRDVDDVIRGMDIAEPPPETGTSTYVRWGRKKCTSAGTKTLHSGYIASSVELGTGGASDFLCLPERPELGDAVDSNPSPTLSYLGGIRYGLMENAPFDGVEGNKLHDQGVVCALCHVTNRTTVATLLGQRSCPHGWTREYSGFLAANSDHRSEAVCLDGRPTPNKKVRQERESQGIVLVVLDSGPLVQETGSDHLVPCSVCSL